LDRLPAGNRGGRPMVADDARGEAAGMTLKPNTSQRDLVRLSLLLCGERTGAKYRPPVKAAG
jgi:hypothetical protein